MFLFPYEIEKLVSILLVETKTFFMYRILYIFVLIGLLSCDSKKKENSPVANQTTSLEDINKEKGKQLAVKYNAIANWNDSIYYSIWYQTTLPKETIAFKGTVKDIVGNDGKRIVSLYNNTHGRFLAILLLDSTQLNEIDYPKSKKYTRGYFIFKVDNVTPILSVNSYASAGRICDEEDIGKEVDVEVDIEHDFGPVLELRGRLIDYYLNKQQ
jgi:hypothetical protein